MFNEDINTKLKQATLVGVPMKNHGHVHPLGTSLYYVNISAGERKILVVYLFLVWFDAVVDIASLQLGKDRSRWSYVSQLFGLDFLKLKCFETCS